MVETVPKKARIARDCADARLESMAWSRIASAYPVSERRWPLHLEANRPETIIVPCGGSLRQATQSNDGRSF
jgi:hypothetical protein